MQRPRRGNMRRGRTLGLIAAALVAAGGLPLAAPAKPAPIAPVAPVVSADPADGVARGTMILVHGGGWAGHSPYGQQLLMKRPGELLLRRDWRVVSVDYNEGAAGLQDVLDTVEAELARRTTSGPLCIYGESSGAHLALVAASRLGKLVDCVIGLGTPADISLYEGHSADKRGQVGVLARRVDRFFGSTAAETAAWNPVTLAPSIEADVLLLREGDDHLVTAAQSEHFAGAHPATRTVALEAGNPKDPSDAFVHGTLSAAGRAQYASEIASFADRAVAAPDADRRAARARAAAEGPVVPAARRTPIMYVHSIALSAQSVRKLIALIAPHGR